jgi:hypothetical protein
MYLARKSYHNNFLTLVCELHAKEIKISAVTNSFIVIRISTNLENEAHLTHSSLRISGRTGGNFAEIC